MAKKSTALTVKTTSENLTSGFETGLALYENTASAIIPAYHQMLRSGTSFVMQRLKIGYHLAQLRATEKGALKTFCKLAMAGQVGGAKMTKYHLETSLATFDQCCKDLGYGKKDVLALEAEHKLKEAQLELWTETPPETADELLKAMHKWALEKGIKAAHDSIIMQPSSEPPHTDEPEPTDPVQAAIDSAASDFDSMKKFLETDLHWQQEDDTFPELTPEEAAEHTCTWSLLPTATKQMMVKLGKRMVASAERMLKMDAGRTASKTKKGRNA